MVSTDGVFVVPRAKREEANAARLKFTSKDGDHLTLLAVARAFAELSPKQQTSWCHDNFINIRCNPSFSSSPFPADTLKAMNVFAQGPRYLSAAGKAAAPAAAAADVMWRGPHIPQKSAGCRPVSAICTQAARWHLQGMLWAHELVSQMHTPPAMFITEAKSLAVKSHSFRISAFEPCVSNFKSTTHLLHVPHLQVIATGQQVFIHPSSVLIGKKVDCIVFSELVLTTKQ
eukprot:1160003-Pelagomonas_calceolata.AAC.3